MATTLTAPQAAAGVDALPRRRLASMPERIAGAAIDALILAVLTSLIAARLTPDLVATTQVRITASGERIVIAAPGPDLWLTLLPVALTAIYLIVFIAVWGRTPGGWAIGIRCVRADTGGRPGWLMATKRWALLFGVAGALSFLPVVGPWAWLVTVVIGLSPLWDRTGLLRGYHDVFAGDLVVRDRPVGARR